MADEAGGGLDEPVAPRVVLTLQGHPQTWPLTPDMLKATTWTEELPDETKQARLLISFGALQTEEKGVHILIPVRPVEAVASTVGWPLIGFLWVAATPATAWITAS